MGVPLFWGEIEAAERALQVRGGQQRLRGVAGKARALVLRVADADHHVGHRDRDIVHSPGVHRIAKVDDAPRVRRPILRPARRHMPLQTRAMGEEGEGRRTAG